MEIEEFIIYTRDGLKLHSEHFVAEKPRAVICLVHGFGEHLGRYHELMKFFNAENIASLAMDLRGHGKSGGLRGHAPGHSLLMSDIEELLKAARAEYTESPIFLYGHSLGGGLTLQYILHNNTNELSGFIASSPWIRLAFEPPKWKEKVGGLASKIAPRIRLDSNLNIKALCRDPDVVSAYEEDPLVNLKISARLYEIAKNAGTDTLAHSGSLKLPGLLFHGSADQITDHRATEHFANNHPDDVKFHLLENFYHEAHHDPGKENVLHMIRDWVYEMTK